MHNLTKSIKILVISSHSKSRTQLRTDLQNAHYDVITAQSEFEALKLAPTVQPDLTIIDLEMGNLDSFLLLEQLKNHRIASQIPLLILVQKEFIPPGIFDDGLVSYIQRPFPLEELKGKIRNILAIREESRRLKEKMHQVERQLASKFAHELKFPISIISGFAQLISNENGCPEVTPRTEYIHQIIKQADHMKDRIEDLNYLLQFEKIVEEVDIIGVIKTAIQKFQNLIEEKNQRVIFNIQDHSKIIIKGRRQHLYMAFRHLISNAHKYTPRGGTISIGIKLTHRSVLAEVADTGIGISPSQKEFLTQFLRRDQEGATLGTDIGLGLVIVKSIVERHQGRFGFESRLGSGSRFWVEIPFNQHDLLSPGFPSLDTR